MSGKAPAAAKATPSIPLAAPQPAMLRRQCACGAQTFGEAECPACKEKHSGLVARAAAGPVAMTPLAIVQDVLQSPGRALEADTRSEMGKRFGRDFSRVRVHVDAHAAESAAAVNAHAYTVGDHIVFGRGQYAPRTAAGSRLAAHELAHVVQQSGQRPAATSLAVGSPSDPAEAEADQMARSALSGNSVPLASVQPAGRLLRDAETETPGQRLARQEGTVLESFIKLVVETDQKGYSSIEFTIRRTDTDLIPGFQKKEPITTRPSGTTWTTEGTVREQLKPVLDIATLQGPSDWKIIFSRNATGQMRLTKTESAALPKQPAPVLPQPVAPTSPTPDAETMKALDADADRIVKIQDDATYFSEGDSKTVLAILYPWAFKPNPPGAPADGSYYLNTLFKQLRARTKGSTNYYAELYSRFASKPLRELRELRNYYAP